MYALPQRIFGVMTNTVLLAIPLFIFMGVMLERSRIAEDLLETMGRLFGALPGGLGISVVLVGVLLAAAKGVVGATVVTIALITLPTMLRHGYDPRLAAGTVAATATLAQILPPATVLVLLGDQLNNSYQAAQLAQGTFAPESISVADLFAGALVPGLTLVALYLAFLVMVAIVSPKSVPPIPPDPAAPRGLALVAQVGKAIGRACLLIVVVLGSILIGLASPTEAAAVGAVGAVLLAAQRIEGAARAPGALCLAGLLILMALRGRGFDLRPFLVVVMFVVAGCLALAIHQVWRAGYLTPTITRTTQMTAMIFTILIGATLFSLVFRGLGGDDMVHRALVESAGRRRRRDPDRDAGDVPARLRDGRVRDHLRGGADRRAAAVAHGGCRSGLARHHDGGEPADLLHAPAARSDLVLPAWRRAAGDHHAAHLCRHHSVRADPAVRAGGAVVRAGTCDRPAANAVWRMRGAR